VREKICLVIPSLQAGGMERVMSELACFLSFKSEIELHLILYGFTREIFYSIPENISIHKPTYEFKEKWRLYFTIKTMFYLRKTIKQIKPKSILSFGEYWNNFVLLSIRGLKYPVFISDRSQPDKSLGLIHNSLRNWLYPAAKGLIFQTEKAKDIYLQRNFHQNIAVIGNPIRKISNRKVFVNREKFILMVGRLIESKHQDILIEIFANINLPDWKLIIVGYDHLKQCNLDRLRELARDLNIEHRVVFKGKQKNLDEIYLKSSIFAFTSSSEGFPNAIGEAMSAGIPVVAFDCIAGPSEMVKDNYNGFLISLYDKKKFQEKLEYLMTNEDIRADFGERAIMDIKKYSTDKIGQQYFDFILSRKMD
jgi:glycosyltransferase involved in cell wall biosynthesis